jgi:hypothetical protein
MGSRGYNALASYVVPNKRPLLKLLRNQLNFSKDKDTATEVSQAFKWFVEKKTMMDNMWQEFNMYAHHYRHQGELEESMSIRNMVLSLSQQLAY